MNQWIYISSSQRKIKKDNLWALEQDISSGTAFQTFSVCLGKIVLSRLYHFVTFSLFFLFLYHNACFVTVCNFNN